MFRSYLLLWNRSLICIWIHSWDRWLGWWLASILLDWIYVWFRKWFWLICIIFKWRSQFWLILMLWRLILFLKWKFAIHYSNQRMMNQFYLHFRAVPLTGLERNLFWICGSQQFQLPVELVDVAVVAVVQPAVAVALPNVLVNSVDCLDLSSENCDTIVPVKNDLKFVIESKPIKMNVFFN